MQNIFEKYIHSISKKFVHLETSEMGYRTDFEILLKEIFESINVRRIDHDAKAKQGNKPDFVILKYDVPILYIEAKDIGVNLDKVEKSEQMIRYFGYANLVLTDYLEFRFYRNGLKYNEPIKIGTYDVKSRTITSFPDSYDHASKTLLDFAQSHKEPIRSGEHLAKIMGGKAQRIRDNVKQFLSTESEKNTEILRVYKTIKKLLVHDLTKDSFADMYAQTLVYGLFVARYHDDTPENFNRREARDLVPASNPFLRHFFDHIVGTDYDKRLEYIVNELCLVFSHANVPLLMKQYFQDDLWGKTHEGPDPVIHFYEDFLKEYDADLRKKLGAYYTPLPVVRFIVRSVDYLLEKEFGLSNGLADTSKSADNIHRVQILDPAVGTGTFISATIRIIYDRLLKGGQIGRWPAYVHNDLLPRLHGFELMMAPYTIAHLKLSMAFKETGFKYFNRRLGIYLTNSLEESDLIGDLFSSFGFAESIAQESKEAATIKNETPIMVVIGNPPYSVSSSNKGKWITDLIQDYKKELNERNIQPLSDDYIKFIRFAEHFIEKSKTGIVAMITNNTFIDGIIHRQMRKHLLETFSDIYILDLHGSSKKVEKTIEGAADKNVFDIQQGVAISIFLRKTKEKQDLATVHWAELYGNRQYKFDSLNAYNLDKISWQRLIISEPYYFFAPKNFTSVDEYKEGFKVDELFSKNSMGIATARDDQLIKFTKSEIQKLIDDFLQLNKKEFLHNYNFPRETEDWQYDNAKKDLSKTHISSISYRPFDNRWTIYSGNAKGVMARPRGEVMKNFLHKNIALNLCKNIRKLYNPIFISEYISDKSLLSSLDNSYTFPLYLFSKDGTKVPNLKKEIMGKIENIIGNTQPENILDYIYAVLHSPSYREKYKEFLKIDFPRIPYPKDSKTFKELVSFGSELRLLHLFESPKVNRFITTFPVEGSDIVEKIIYNTEKVYINDNQYFGNVKESVWNFYIGGYQPAQKWLKDRKNRKLTNSEIEHYQKIIVALDETDRIMKEIDKIEI
ncbi:MAG: DNA methyltransferase [Ignavibacteriales bacterium]|nr:MAG: DNA methyltransferase [Ignavibacteriales bacterium]